MPELSLQRFVRGETQVLDDRADLSHHAWATVQDEGIVLIETPDGGSAWVSGAGPDLLGCDQRGTTIDVSVDELTPEIAELVFLHARRNGMVIAVWPSAPKNQNYAYAWDAYSDVRRRDAEATGQEFELRARPVAVLATSPRDPSEIPADWRQATVCESGADVLARLLA